MKPLDFLRQGVRNLGVKATLAMSSVFMSGRSLYGTIRESFAGAWQRNIEAETKENMLAFSAVYACVKMIAEDVAKLRIRLMEQTPSGIWEEVTRASPYWQVLRKPNAFQTRIQFLVNWMTSKLLFGNTYVYLERDSKNIVVRMYVLDPRLVTPVIASDGSVWYQVNQDPLAGLTNAGAIRSSDIIHDRAVTLFHPLIGVSPIFACAASATQGIRIQANSESFFKNMSRPSGHLTSPGTIQDVTALRLKENFERNFSGNNIGKLLVTGDGLKYEAMTIPANDAQLIEQLKWTVADVARAFQVPLYKVSNDASQPVAKNLSEANQDYYNNTLQMYIESIELLLDEGLGVSNVPDHVYGTEFDLDGLLRMDPAGRAAVSKELVGAGIMKLNEARAKENLAPMKGGDTAYLQVQNYSVAALALRDAREDPFAPAKPPEAPKPETPPPGEGEDLPELPAPGNSSGAEDTGEEAPVPPSKLMPLMLPYVISRSPEEDSDAALDLLSANVALRFAEQRYGT